MENRSETISDGGDEKHAHPHSKAVSLSSDAIIDHKHPPLAPRYLCHARVAFSLWKTSHEEGESHGL